MYEKILEQLEAVCKREMDLTDLGLGTLEHVVRQKLGELGRGLLERLVAHSQRGYEGSSKVCACGSSLRFVQYRAKQIHTLFGWIAVPRAYYHCRQCHRAEVPYDQANGLGAEQLSPGLAQLCCLLAVDDSFELVIRKVRLICGQTVPPMSTERLVHQVGAVARDDQDQALQRYPRQHQVPPPEMTPSCLCIAIDGTTVHQMEQWREAKVACLWGEDGRFEVHKRYLGRFDSAAEMGWPLWLEACRCGLYQAREAVYLGDGAAWIRTLHTRHFPQATFIIDWYHADKHLWDCAEVLYGEGSEQTARFVAELADWLWQGCPRKVLVKLKPLHKQHRGPKRKVLTELIHYISTNQEQMRYDEYRAKGYPIGSGAVEGACKFLAGKRLKQAGMIWTDPRASAVLALRLTWLNHRWEQYWDRKPMAAWKLPTNMRCTCQRAGSVFFR